MQVKRQTKQYGSVCILVFEGMDTPDFGSCMPRRGQAIRNDCCIQYQTLVLTSPSTLSNECRLIRVDRRSTRVP